MSGAGAERGSGTTKTPADFLKSIRGRPVVVKLNSGVDYRGCVSPIRNRNDKIMAVLRNFCAALMPQAWIAHFDVCISFGSGNLW
ncbi:hypothetical protein RchiOBHm_Chr7g0189461 [Rosa chinensis]|uniref:LSM domain-containing protein n=1 Tax=Rosa chinensis TaxID=74649 RepID=A0A2P6P4Q6_ROSCH|nr:hypothetical protein RchiOBHm_Chr7g0189461 [Rosa chinensis]